MLSQARNAHLITGITQLTAGITLITGLNLYLQALFAHYAA
jgi:hypothetical protein